MSRARSILVVTSLLLVLVAAGACRQDEPAGDPKTPANSPLPNIDKREDDPKTAPTPKLPLFGDAG